MEVYSITNEVTNEVYIGSTRYNKYYRWGSEGRSGFSHLALMNNGNTAPLYSAMRMYGPEKFKLLTVAELPEDASYSELFELETYYIRLYISDGISLYNRMDSAKGSTDGSQMRTEVARSKAIATVTTKYGGYHNVLNSEESIRKRSLTAQQNGTGIFSKESVRKKSHKFIVNSEYVCYGETELYEYLNSRGYELSRGVVHHLTYGRASKRTLSRYPEILSIIEKIPNNIWRKEEINNDN